MFFSSSSAFSAATISQTIGMFSGSILSVYVCANVKIYVYISFIIASLICYVILLIKHEKINIKEVNIKEVNIKVDNELQEQEKF